MSYFRIFVRLQRKNKELFLQDGKDT